jgi:hypothetical protein
MEGLQPAKVAFLGFGDVQEITAVSYVFLKYWKLLRVKDLALVSLMLLKCIYLAVLIMMSKRILVEKSTSKHGFPSFE